MNPPKTDEEKWKDSDDYMDALVAGRVAPAREIACPACGGRMRVSAHAVGDTLRIWMQCADCGDINHADRGPMFPGWEILDN